MFEYCAVAGCAVPCPLTVAVPVWQHDTREAAALCRRRLETLASLTGGHLSRLAEAALRLASPARPAELTTDPSAGRSAPTAATP